MDTLRHVSVLGSHVPPRRQLRAYAVRWFFAHFFRLVLIAVSVSQCFLLWWLFPRTVATFPLAAQWAAPLIVYGANRWIVAGRNRSDPMRRRAGTGLRAYSAFALTCLFCCAFLLLTGGLWLGARIFLGAIAVEARSVYAGIQIDSTLDTGFRWLANSGIAVVGSAFAYGYTIGQRRLRIARISLPARGRSAALAGLRIVQISDIHIGQNLQREQLQRFVAQVNALQPDLICITGDIADSPSSDLETFFPELARLRAPHGVFAILGNHDHYAGAERVEEALRRLTPCVVLRDQQRVIEINGQRLHVIGLDDRGRDWARGVPAVPYLERAVATLPASDPVLLLCHRPDIFAQAADAGVDLTLAGHTHGGQIGLPWFDGRVRNLAQFITVYDRGLFAHDSSYLYVNCGLGVTGQRIRLSTPREITVIEFDDSVVRERAA